MLRMTGDPIVADELELSLYNGMMGAMHPSDYWWTYNTPMDGVRHSFLQDIAGEEALAGGPDLNCCQGHAARGLGVLRDWALMTCEQGIVLNFYGPGSISIDLPDGGQVTIAQETSYPLDGEVRVTVTPDQPREFVLYLRVPAWSAQTSVLANGEPVPAEPGTYCELRRHWQPGDTIELDLDMSLRYWRGERECEGKAALYRGPILLAYDQRLNSFEPDEVPSIDLDRLNARLLPVQAPYPAPLLMLEVDTVAGQPLVLCDFASAGGTGNPYRSWLPAE